MRTQNCQARFPCKSSAKASHKCWPDSAGYADKTYCIGMNGELYPRQPAADLPAFEADVAAVDMLQETPLHALHLELGAKMAPFAGYDMPLWYRSVSEEHGAVRKGAGIFDVAHMGVFDIQGSGAADFLDQVTTNDVKRLKVGSSHYTYFLDATGIPLDDLMIYRLAEAHYLAVVNASNNDKNWQWLQAVICGEVMIDPRNPGRRLSGSDRFQLRDLRWRQWGSERRVDIALQGPKSRDCLLALDGSAEDKAKVKRLRWAGVTQVTLGGFDLIVSRTGYTGERVAYELFVHPDQAAALFQALVDAGVDALWPGGARQPAHRSRTAALWAGAGRRAQYEPGRRRLRRLRQAVQALLHWQGRLHRPRSAAQIPG